MFFVYRQNNSGGGYELPAMHVIVEADSVKEANEIAQKNGVDPDAPYCECCGRRWYLMWDGEETGEQAVANTPDDYEIFTDKEMAIESVSSTWRTSDESLPRTLMVLKP